MKKIVVFTLGCKVNDCESSSLISLLIDKGYEVSDELCYADAYIINTCAVTHEAEKKSRQAVARALKFNSNASVIICGCASQKNPNSFSKKENVTLVTGARQKSKVVELIESTLTTKEVIADDDSVFDEMPIPTSSKTRAFVKIQDGCNNFCSYCIVPYLRGRSRSRDIDSILQEVVNVTAQEVVLTGIDISSFNDSGKNFIDLFNALAYVDKRIRLGSLEVSVITEGFLSATKVLKNFAPHFHLSLQSGSNSVLKKMNRHYTREEFIEKCNLIYSFYPNAGITTDIIVGFPTESKEDFLDTLTLIDEVNFSQIHCFCYSPREGTVAYKMQDLPIEIKQERLHTLMQKANTKREEYINRFVGFKLDFLYEEFVDGYAEGYSENYIKLYVPQDIKKGIFKVLAESPFKDGLKCVTIK